MPLPPASIALIFDLSKTKILLVKRCDVPFWVLPGGGIEPNESPEAAAIRETYEETKLFIKIEQKCAEYTPINTLSSQTHVFKCHVESGRPQVTDETKEIAFFPIDALPNMFFFIHKNWLQECLSSSQCVKRSLNEITYGALLIYFIKHPWFVLRFAWTRLFKR